MAYTLKQKGQQVQDMLDAVEKKTVSAGGTPYLKEADVTESGLMSPSDKSKLDGIEYMGNSDIDTIMNT